MATRDTLARCPPPSSSPAARSAVALAGGLAALLGVLVELLPHVGGDLVAQQWWASWAASSGGRPIDLGWYAGSPAVSYSLLGPWALTLLGPAVAGVLSTTGGAATTTGLLLRAGARRPRLAGVTAATTFAADQLAGRTTFALGTVAGLVALLVIGSRVDPVPRRLVALLLTALAGALSPVAAAFLGLAAAAWWLGDVTRSRAASADPRTTPRPTRWAGPTCARTVDAAVLLLGATAPLVAMAALGAATGPMTASGHQLLAAVLATAVVFAGLGPDRRLLRTGALLTAAALVVAGLVTDPLGSNTTRLVLLFAVPVLVGTARRDPVLVALAATLVVWLLPPVLLTDLVARDADRTTTAAVLQELAARGPVGRVEVVPLASHQDALLADAVPLARGWTHQLDVARNPLFYDGTLDAGTYVDWLRARGVSYVALAERRPDWAAREEAALVHAGVPGLSRVWSDEHWTLYAVAGSGLLAGPATLVASNRREVVLDARAAGAVSVALVWHEQLTVSGGACIAPGEEGTVLVRTDRPGRVVLSSSWRPRGHCPD